MFREKLMKNKTEKNLHENAKNNMRPEVIKDRVGERWGIAIDRKICIQRININLPCQNINADRVAQEANHKNAWHQYALHHMTYYGYIGLGEHFSVRIFWRSYYGCN